MANPEEVQDFSHIKLERDHPIVMQPWVTPYKPAAKPLPATWKTLISTTVPETKKKGHESAYDQDVFRSNMLRSQNNNNNNSLIGGAKFRPGNEGLNGTMSQKNALTKKSANDGSSNGSFNAFAQAARSAPGGSGVLLNDTNAEEFRAANNNNNNFSSRAGGPGGMMLGGGGLRSLTTMEDEEDEYDDRVDLMKHNLRIMPGSGKAVPHRHRLKSRSEREAARDEYRKTREEMQQSGYNSGGDVDEACVGALGEDDEYRAERLKFTKDAAKVDGTLQSPYHSAIDHYNRRGGDRQFMKTPNSAAKLKRQNLSNPLDYNSSTPPPGNNNNSYHDGSSSGFRPSGLRTPKFDPTSNLPGPVARHHKRQHHHLLRLLHNNNDSSSLHHHGGGGGDAHLFPPHEIPTSEIDTARKENPFNPNTWMLGDATVDDVMQRHFMKK